MSNHTENKIAFLHVHTVKGTVSIEKEWKMKFKHTPRFKATKFEHTPRIKAARKVHSPRFKATKFKHPTHAQRGECLFVF